ncbi:PTS-dependent dihydroxyacetone kinase phosphotransferase subunit DhaM [Clostridium sp. 19966]|uniref:dihydroxyacetone kinase phosphoryl donor subunit DhaM n=1 Tax=Clostridium sp. 19966 TaxID=2768166 RepID=UPI0028DE2935|nr:dihydroxyacetone kinase phosphoryl donor subunit DhaM [Clostridium sp. 19966]MDT8716918.1 PTS-dependent dihydroxyacetone kinase phosphotransferase subunit DhaM [Clostridium sp. 19966]
MVGLVLVSHSEKVAEGVKELSLQMAEDVKIAAAGGTQDGRLGTDINKIINAVNEVYSEDGVLILFDLGSSYMNAEMALELLDYEGKVEIVDAGFVEGAVVAAVECSLNKSKAEIKRTLEKLSLHKMQ